MGKVLILAGLIITIVGISLLAMTSMNVANINNILSTHTCYPANCTSATIDSSTMNNGQLSLFNSAGVNLYQPYAQVIVYVEIYNPNSYPVTYTVQLLAQGFPYSNATITVAPQQQSNTITLSLYFAGGLPHIPVFMEPALRTVPNIDFALQINPSILNSNSPFRIVYLGEILDKIVLPITLILTVAGLVIVSVSIILSFRKKSAARPRTVGYQSSLYEPTLSSSIQKNQNKQSSRSRTTRTSSIRPATTKGLDISRTASNVTRCRSCQKPMPAKSQYCPHCYTRQ